MEDAELIRQVLAGRHEQYALLVQRYQEPLIGFLRRFFGNEEEVFDCAQEAFLAAYRNLWRYSFEHSFRAWLYSIARNRAIDMLRKRKHEVPLEYEPEVESSNSPEEEWIKKEKTFFIREVLEELPEHYRNALYLRYMQELSYEEIAQVLNVPVSSVKTYLHRGKEKLRQHMERRGIYERERGILESPV